jgi:glycosyltransferase involved in cell wall biosynthesis
MKILHITYEPPTFPGGTGGQTRQYGLLKHLSKNHEIHVICPFINSNQKAPLNEEIFSGISMPPPKTYFTKMLNFILRYRHLTHPKFTRIFEGMGYSMMPIIKREIDHGNYDLLNIEHTNAAHWLTSFKFSIPTVIVAHNVKTIMWKRYYENHSGFKRRQFFREYRKFEKYESTYLKYYQCIIAMSDTDRQYLKSLCPEAKRIEVVPNGVDLDYFSPSLNQRVEPFSLLFSGTMGHPPNEEAMIFFCHHIFPKVLHRFPNAKLTIVGRAPSPSIEKWGKQHNIQVTGFVPDTRPYFEKAEVFIVPLLSGSGTRLKILEAMAMGKAIVSTSIGAEGIEYTHEKNIVIANDAEQFAESILTLFQNRDYRKKLEESAKLLVAEKYSWNIMAMKLEKICMDLVGLEK